MKMVWQAGGTPMLEIAFVLVLPFATHQMLWLPRRGSEDPMTPSGFFYFYQNIEVVIQMSWT